jgi:hypothetical protein
MENPYAGLDAEALKILYDKENLALNARLLEGVPWNELRDQRKKVTKLAIALHKKVQALNAMNPAEFPSNDMEGR